MTQRLVREPSEITLRDLENVVALAECNSVTLAARSVGLSQPAMSSALKNLEATLKTTLFIRRRGQGVSATPEGKQFATEARKILAQVGDLRAEMSGNTTPDSSRLIVGSLTTVAPIVAPSLIRTFGERFPRIAVDLKTGSQDQLLDWLQSGEVHLAITYDLRLADSLKFERLADAVPHVLLSARHPFARRPHLRLSDLAAEPYILLDLPISRDYFTSLFLADELSASPAASYSDLTLVRSIVGNELGYSLVNLLPARADAVDGTELAYVPLESTVPPLGLGIAVRRDDRQLRSVKAFVDHARQDPIFAEFGGTSS